MVTMVHTMSGLTEPEQGFPLVSHQEIRVLKSVGNRERNIQQKLGPGAKTHVRLDEDRRTMKGTISTSPRKVIFQLKRHWW